MTTAIHEGLIISSGGEPTAALDELSAYCGWPVVMQATPARLRQKFSWRAPRALLVWLDDRRDLAASIRLLGWLRASHPGVRRLTVAHRLADRDIEPAIRSAGVHFFLAVDDQVRRVAEGLLSRWFLAAESVPVGVFRAAADKPVLKRARAPQPYTERGNRPP